MADKRRKKVSEDERREIRHKRRVRSQMLAYLSLVLILIAIGVGGFFGVKYIVKMIKDNHQAEVEPAVSENTVSVSEDEGVGVIATPESFEETMDEIDEGYLTEETSPEEEENPEARAFVDGLTLEQKVAAMIVTSPESIMEGVNTATRAGDSTKAALEEIAVGGLIYESKNVQSTDQFTEMITKTQEMFNAAYNYDMWICLDKDNAFDYESAGVNFFISPANAFPGGDILTMDAVSAFPFEDGNTDTDTEETLDEMRENRFDSFNIAIAGGADAVVMSNACAPNASGDGLPCSLSYAMMTEVLRDELGFDGVIITGRMNDAKITAEYSSGDAALMAVQAGADIILCPDNPFEAYDAVLTAVQEGSLEESRIDESLMRIYTVRFKTN